MQTPAAATHCIMLYVLGALPRTHTLRNACMIHGELCTCHVLPALSISPSPDPRLNEVNARVRLLPARAPLAPCRSALAKYMDGVGPPEWTRRSVLVGGDASSAVSIARLGRDISCIIPISATTTPPSHGCHARGSASAAAVGWRRLVVARGLTRAVRFGCCDAL